MLSRPTTFIVGAGASFELGLPTGEGLQENIEKILRVDHNSLGFVNQDIWNALLPSFRDNPNWPSIAKKYQQAAEKIIAGMPTAASIDNFLHTHRDDQFIVRLGKLAIAYAILDSEGRSHLWSSDTLGTRDYNRFTSDGYRRSWYYPLIKMLTMGTLTGDPAQLLKNLKFIVFNYDRCLEMVLRNAVRSYYDVSLDDASKIVADSVEIIHPYGSLGTLPAMVGADGTPFGGSSTNLLAVAAGIKTFTEAVDSDVVSQAQHAVGNAEVLVFMGFGFLSQNVDLIAPDENRTATRIHATTYGFSETDKMIIAEQLKRFLKRPPEAELRHISQVGASKRDAFIDIENTSCRSLIENHRMRLMEG